MSSKSKLLGVLLLASAAAFAAKPRVMAPIFVDDRAAAQAWVVIDAGTFAVEAAPLLAAIQSALTPAVFERVSTSPRITEGNLSLIAASALTNAGLAVRFDDKALEVRVTIAPDARAPRTVPISERGRGLPVAPPVPPSDVSGYLNVRVAKDFANTNLPLDNDFEHVLNVRNWVLESNFRHDGGDDPGWVRASTRVVHDWPESLLRLAVGDVTPPTVSYQRGRLLGGFTLSTQFALQPEKIFYPLSRGEILLKRPSRVRVHVNGRLVKTLDLPAGQHRFTDLPLDNGVSEIRIDATDDLGREETFRFEGLLDNQLLDEGVNQGALSFGAPSRVYGHALAYDSNLTVSGFFRHGFTEHLTAGAYLDGDPYQKLIGAESGFMTPWGRFSLDTALSRETTTGFAAKLGYLYLDSLAANEGARQFGLVVETRSRGFATLGTRASPEPVALALAANASRSLGSGWYGGVGASTSHLRAELAAGRSWVWLASANVQKSWTNEISATIDVSYGRTSAYADNEAAVYLNLSWALPERNEFAYLNADSRARSARAAWQRRPAFPVGGLSSEIAVERQPSQTLAEARGDYLSSRSAFGATLGARRHDDGRSNGSALVRAGVGIAHAGTHVALGRPVPDAFALVATQNSLENEIVEVNPDTSTSRAMAYADGFGPGVAMELVSYREALVRLGNRQLAPGLDLGAEYRLVKPSYREGLLILTGTEASVFARGRAVDATGQPVSLMVGTLRRGDESIDIFTNRVGRFAAEGLKPGTYDLLMGDGRRARLEIPSGTRGLYDAGTLQLPVGAR